MKSRLWMGTADRQGVNRTGRKDCLPQAGTGGVFPRVKGNLTPSHPIQARKYPPEDTLQGARPYRPEGHRFRYRIL